jgi:hypothetical protein
MFMVCPRIRFYILSYKTEINDRRGSAVLTTRHPSIHKKLALNLIDKWRSLSRYSSLAEFCYSFQLYIRNNSKRGFFASSPCYFVFEKQIAVTESRIFSNVFHTELQALH